MPTTMSKYKVPVRPLVPARVPRPVPRPDPDDAVIERLTAQLEATRRDLAVARADDEDDAEVARIREMLADAGVTDAQGLMQLIRRRNVLVVTDDEPLSPLYSNLELQSFTNKDSVDQDIAAVAINGGIGSYTLAQAPMRWQMTDLIFGGVVAASGFEHLVKLELLLGGQVITSMRFSEFSRQTREAMISDNLKRFQSYKFGPNSSVVIRVTNNNTGAGQTFSGYFQYTYVPLPDSIGGM